ncbi:MAG: short chain dehydrogenase [Comamonadaceae bacterium]|nr:short chain dehydrogenase [Comamonadaceae bacterium]
MLVLLTGATGFLGKRIVQALLLAGHEVIQVRRRASGTGNGQWEQTNPRQIEGDFSRDQQASDWVERLRGVDVVVNAAGILRESAGRTFADVHVRGPCALFEACVLAGVRRVVQVSALGADRAACSVYHLSKRAADDHLLTLPLSAVVVQPSLLFGPGGASASLFSMLAALPVIPVPDRGQQMIQPLHVDDAVRAIVALLREDAPAGRVELVGPTALSLKAFLLTLRQSLGLGVAKVLPVPAGLVDLAAWGASWRRNAVLDSNTWHMLQRGNTGDPVATRVLLGEAPRAPALFFSQAEAPMHRLQAQLAWLLPLLRWSLATVWIATAVVSLWVYPVDQSLQLLQRVGAPPAWGPFLLWSAALLDLALGIAALSLHRWRPLWSLQALLIVFYTVVITLRMPEFWAHPYGPLLKNLPMLGLLFLLHELTPRSVTQQPVPEQVTA